MISKKLLWIIFAILVTFDNVFSYIAIVYHGMREANPITAFFVSITPLAYFILIPVSLLFCYSLIKVLTFFSMKKEKIRKPEKREIIEMIERIALTCVILAWGIGATSFNLITLLRGFSPLRINWKLVTLSGVILALAYAVYMGYKMKKKRRT